MMEKISLEEKHRIQIEMLKEIDTFCSQHGIRYSLAFGTLIGAIRHKGFIPWDDDMDIMMPISDMLKFKESFKSDSLKYIDIDTDSNFKFPFSRIFNNMTFSKCGRYNNDIGINIDLYPIVDIPYDKEIQSKFFRKAIRLQKIRRFLMLCNSAITRFFPIKRIFLLKYYVKKNHDFLLQSGSYGKTKRYFIICMPLAKRKKVIFNVDLFENLVNVQFEGLNVKSIGKYDTYLRQVYGNYMQLPPEEDRVPYHGGDYYWK